MKRKKLFFRISPGNLTLVGPSIGKQLNVDITLKEGQKRLELNTPIELKESEYKNISATVKITEKDTKRAYDDVGSGSTNIKVPFWPGEWVYPVTVIVSTKGGDKIKSATFFQDIILTVSEKKQDVIGPRKTPFPTSKVSATKTYVEMEGDFPAFLDLYQEFTKSSQIVFSLSTTADPIEENFSPFTFPEYENVKSVIDKIRESFSANDLLREEISRIFKTINGETNAEQTLKMVNESLKSLLDKIRDKSGFVGDLLTIPFERLKDIWDSLVEEFKQDPEHLVIIGSRLAQAIFGKLASWTPDAEAIVVSDINPIKNLFENLEKICSCAYSLMLQLRAKRAFKKLRMELENIEGKTRNTHIYVTGHSPYAGADTSRIRNLSDHATLPRPEIPGSLPHVIEQLGEELKCKIDTLAEALGKTLYHENIKWDVEPIPGKNPLDLPQKRKSVPTPEKAIKQEMHDIEKKIDKLIYELPHKIDTLAEALGQTLVRKQTKWDVEPALPFEMLGSAPDKSIPVKPPPEVPKKAIKEELHDIEDMLIKIIDLLKKLKIFIDIDIINKIKIIIGPILIKLTVIINSLKKLKWIFIYDEGIIQFEKTGDKTSIKIRTDAFDLGGWFDFTPLRKNDSVSVSLFVHLPAKGKRRKRRLYKHCEIKDRRDYRLMNLFDLFGVSCLVGNYLEITVELTSQRDPNKILVIPFQLVVESQALPGMIK